MYYFPTSMAKSNPKESPKSNQNCALGGKLSVGMRASPVASNMTWRLRQFSVQRAVAPNGPCAPVTSDGTESRFRIQRFESFVKFQRSSSIGCQWWAFWQFMGRFSCCNSLTIDILLNIISKIPTTNRSQTHMTHPIYHSAKNLNQLTKNRWFRTDSIPI